MIYRNKFNTTKIKDFRASIFQDHNGKMNKKGQFYLIAAIFIVLILFGFSSVNNYAIVKPEPRSITDISEELNRETYNLIEHGVFNEEDIEGLVSSFAEEDIPKYVLKNDEDAAMVFVFGDRDRIDVVSVRNRNIGDIKIAGAELTGVTEYARRKDNVATSGDFVEVEVLDKDYKFQLKDNQMFYFLIVKERGEEVFIERNKEDKSNKAQRPGGAGRINIPGLGG
jgi:hypothetical protein